MPDPRRNRRRKARSRTRLADLLRASAEAHQRMLAAGYEYVPPTPELGGHYRKSVTFDIPYTPEEC